MKNSKFKIIFRYTVVAIMFMPLVIEAQSLQEKLQQCPVTIENGKINYYMPQQNGAFFQLPPARKPYYVNIAVVPWVQPLTMSVKDTQHLVLAELAQSSKQTKLATEDKSLFLRKLAWCVMLQTSKVKEIDRNIMDYTQQLGEDGDITVSSQAKLVLKLVEDYGSLGK